MFIVCSYLKTFILYFTICKLSSSKHLRLRLGINWSYLYVRMYIVCSYLKTFILYKKVQYITLLMSSSYIASYLIYKYVYYVCMLFRIDWTISWTPSSSSSFFKALIRGWSTTCIIEADSKWAVGEGGGRSWTGTRGYCVNWEVGGGGGEEGGLKTF